jgi:hypothetical protein
MKEQEARLRKESRKQLISALKPFILWKENQKFLEGKSLWTAREKILIRWLVAAIVSFGVMGGILTYARITGNQIVKRIEKYGRAGEAVVVSKRSTFTETSGTIYLLTYRFEAEINGVHGTYRKESEVSKETYERITQGNTISILYDAYEAANCVIQEAGEDTLKIKPFPLGWWMITGLIVLWLLRSLWHTHKLANKGEPIAGVIEESNITGDDSVMVRIHYTFTIPGGRIIEGKAKAPHFMTSIPLSRRQPQRGDPVVVLYWRERNFIML